MKIKKLPSQFFSLVGNKISTSEDSPSVKFNFRGLLASNKTHRLIEGPIRLHMLRQVAILLYNLKVTFLYN